MARVHIHLNRRADGMLYRDGGCKHPVLILNPGEAREIGYLIGEELPLLISELRDLERERIPTTITFKEITMNPTEAGQTQVFTGTLAPAGSQLPTDTVATLTSNDSLVSPSLDSTNLIVSVTYPDGWVESTTTPLAFAYNASSTSNPAWSLSGTITPSAPPVNVVLPTSIGFAQTE